jgi:hypothetical protein
VLSYEKEIDGFVHAASSTHCIRKNGKMKNPIFRMETICSLKSPGWTKRLFNMDDIEFAEVNP